MNNQLSISNISIRYGAKTIISDVSFDVGSASLCALLGLNGSGKTTLLKGLCRLVSLTGGRILCDDVDLTLINEKERARYVSYIPQRHSKLIGITVIDAVLMGLNTRLGLFDTPTQKHKSEAMQALEKLEIPHLAYEDFSHLSEGQKQLVILARTLLQNTPVMLLDEPDSSLDFPNKHMSLSKIRDLVHAENKACIITLHDPNLALKYCDKLVLLDKGKVMSTLSLTGASNDDIVSCLGGIYGEEFYYDSKRYL
ncbi:MAG: ABC transporter ATP-binding protein [Oscillospiraceae bacterium]|nr:ABC transporter ATP-binding protein [Oscillospiraceae bacterium]